MSETLLEFSEQSNPKQTFHSLLNLLNPILVGKFFNLFSIKKEKWRNVRRNKFALKSFVDLFCWQYAIRLTMPHGLKHDFFTRCPITIWLKKPATFDLNTLIILVNNFNRY
ncbi:hypothetical protein Atep_19540 [Allochromatium tepidum]|uniref:Transposase n=1 Tax=Allochromatium tepidum TaxID=553982 RepID=A0ABN6GCV3_9GAMM|nr:hypothetical protein Atep_19540 [Allochromatium tepidum]